jgi:hypothetical protein
MDKVLLAIVTIVAPLELTQLRGPQTVAEGDQDHGGIALAPAIAPGGSDQLLNLRRSIRKRIRRSSRGSRRSRRRKARREVHGLRCRRPYGIPASRHGLTNCQATGRMNCRCGDRRGRVRLLPPTVGSPICRAKRSSECAMNEDALRLSAVGIKTNPPLKAATIRPNLIR